MTTKGKSYDPFAFGQVKLGSPSASGDASPEDVLFAEPGPAAGGDDSSWDPPTQFAETGMPTAAPVATRIPQPAAASRAAVVASPATRAIAEAAPAAAAPAARATESSVRKAAAVPVRSVAPVALPAREPAGPAAVVVPFVILAAVESVAAWLWIGQSNPVLGGLAAVLGLGLAALGFCALRR